MNKIKAAHMEVRKMVANGATDAEIRAYVDSVLGVKKASTSKWLYKVIEILPWDNNREHAWSYHKTLQAAEREAKKCQNKAKENKYRIDPVK
jgi:hypothetical protein